MLRRHFLKALAVLPFTFVGCKSRPTKHYCIGKVFDSSNYAEYLQILHSKDEIVFVNCKFKGIAAKIGFRGHLASYIFCVAIGDE